MNWLKWFVCWWYRRHLMGHFYDKDGRAKRKCIRCGWEA